MKKTPHSAHILGICLVALVSYVWLNGQGLGLLLQEKELPRWLATAVQGFSRVTGGDFLTTELAAGLTRLSEQDVLLGQGEAPENEKPVESALPVESEKPVESALPARAMESVQKMPTQQSPAPVPAVPPVAETAPAVPSAVPSVAPPVADAAPAVPPAVPSVAPPVADAAPAPSSAPDTVQPAPAVPVAEAVPSPTPPPIGSATAAGSTSPERKSGKGGKSIFDTAPSQRYTVMLAGDSFMEDMILAIQRTWYNKDPHVRFISVAKHSTGLCVSTKWNWPKKLEEFVEKHKPDVVLIFMGANDLGSIFDGETRYAFTSPAWKQKYVEIAESMIDAVRKGNAVPIWIGLPVMGIEPYSKWVPLVSQLQKQASQNKGVDYIETTPILGDAEGQYRVFATSSTGAQVRLRKADKYHVAFAGCLLILEQAVPRIRAHILEKEKKHVLSTTAAP